MQILFPQLKLTAVINSVSGWMIYDLLDWFPFWGFRLYVIGGRTIIWELNSQPWMIPTLQPCILLRWVQQ